jgi:RNA polymerase sigma-70 factor (ECF subfamily)
MLLTRTKALVERAKRGDRGAFSDLVTRHRHRLEALIRCRFQAHLETELEAEDVFQETVLKAFESLGSFSWRGRDSFMRWMGVIAENVMRSAARRKARRRVAPLDGDIPFAEASHAAMLRRRERFDRFQAAFDSLDPDSRKVIYLARIKGLPMKEVAAQIGRTANASSILLYRALIKLREIFGDTESLSLPPVVNLKEGESGNG